MSTRSTPAAPSPASSRKTMPALSALPNTDAPATSRRMSRPDAGLAMTPTVTAPDTRGTLDPPESFWSDRSHDQVALRHLHGPLPPGGGEPDPRAPARPRARPAPRPARLRRGVDRRAPLGRQRDHRLARDLHRGRGRAHAPHQARHRRRLARLPQPAVGHRAHGPSRSPDPRARDARRRAGVAADRLGDDRPHAD